jgi:hypothetical protein
MLAAQSPGAPGPEGRTAGMLECMLRHGRMSRRSTPEMLVHPPRRSARSFRPAWNPGPGGGSASPGLSQDPRIMGDCLPSALKGPGRTARGVSPHRYTQLSTASAPLVRASTWTSGAQPIGVPEGRSENSTALQCRGPFVDALTSPVGTTEIPSQLQSSLRDLRQSLPRCPGTEVPVE